MDDAIKALLATKGLRSTKKDGQTVQVWKASQHLGDFEKEGDKVIAKKYVAKGLAVREKQTFDTETDALNWISE